MDQLFTNLAHALYTSVGRHLEAIQDHLEADADLYTMNQEFMDFLEQHYGLDGIAEWLEYREGIE